MSQPSCCSGGGDGRCHCRVVPVVVAAIVMWPSLVLPPRCLFHGCGCRHVVVIVVGDAAVMSLVQVVVGVGVRLGWYAAALQAFRRGGDAR
jgi:hypothetical protein